MTDETETGPAEPEEYPHRAYGQRDDGSIGPAFDGVINPENTEEIEVEIVPAGPLTLPDREPAATTMADLGTKVPKEHRELRTAEPLPQLPDETLMNIVADDLRYERASMATRFMEALIGLPQPQGRRQIDYEAVAMEAVAAADALIEELGRET